ncbi:Fic protein [Streptomyces sp. NBRC 110611]|uniref:COG1470 family protein n=1 Tax=Streptomyces sp. NBRC 110611 TaxID=1621259 RepID=UPI000857321D|nr:hypothetical protein [Streptomyces sp. NBRC 110611]GAU70304.1 Fic protein [Streptomyces sp. NBRC 110611]
MTLRAQLIVPDDTVEPGASVTAQLLVWNESRIVDAYDLTLLGPPGQWRDPHLGQLAVYPGNHERISIPLTVPRSSDLLPGTLVFAVRVSSAQNPARAAVPEAEIPIGEFREVEPRLTRTRLGGRFSGSNLITLTNRGNTAVHLRLRTAPEDAKAPLRSRVRRSRVVLRAGEKARIGVLLRVTRPVGLGEPATWDVGVSAEWDAKEIRRETFAFEQRPLLTKRALKALTALVAAVVAGTALWLSPVGGGEPKARTVSADGPSQQERAKAAEQKAAKDEERKQQAEEKKQQEKRKAAEEAKAPKRKPLQHSLVVKAQDGGTQDEFTVGKGYWLKLSAIQITAAGPPAATLTLTAGSLPLATMNLDKARDFTPKSPVVVQEGETVRLTVRCPTGGTRPATPPSPGSGTAQAPTDCTAIALVTGEQIPNRGPFSKDA